MNPCKHCGLSSPEGDFCCFGCEAAYQFIKGAGLGQYYQSSPSKKVDFESNQTQESGFDDPEFLNRYPLISTSNEQKANLREGEFSIDGIVCSACVWLIEKLPQLNSQCSYARLDLSKSSLYLRWRDGEKSLSQIAFDLKKMGYQLLPMKSKVTRARSDWIRLGVTGASAAGAMHVGLLFIAAHQHPMASEDARALGYLVALASLPAITYGAWPFFRSTWLSLKFKALHPDLLVVLSILLGSFRSLYQTSHGQIENYFDSLSMVIFLLLLGRYFLEKSRRSIQEREDTFVNLKDNSGKLNRKAASLLSSGDEIILSSDEEVPTDAELMSCSGWIDLSALTGEPYPQIRMQGNFIPQGARISRQSVHLKCLVDAWNSTHQKSLREIEERNFKTPKKYFESAFTAGALIIISVLSISLHLTFEQTIALLIVTCPCSLLLAKPLTLISAQSWLKRNGILLLHPDRLTNLLDIKRILFDKTGTLTSGRLEIDHDEDSSSEKMDDPQHRHLLAQFLSLASQSQHPICRALVFHWHSQGIEPATTLSDIKDIPGTGIQGQTPEMLLLEIKSSERNSPIDKLQSALFINKQEWRTYTFKEQMRLEVPEVLHQLKKIGYDLQIISGDRPESIHQAIQNLESYFSEIKGSLKPEEKAASVQANDFMIGDGLNDSLAFKKSRFSLGFTGTAEANQSTADAYFTKKDLRGILSLLQISQKSDRWIKISLGISILYNAVTVSLVLLDYAGPVLCAIFMPLSSLTVLGLAMIPFRTQITSSKPLSI